MFIYKCMCVYVYIYIYYIVKYKYMNAFNLYLPVNQDKACYESGVGSFHSTSPHFQGLCSSWGGNRPFTHFNHIQYFTSYQDQDNTPTKIYKTV